MDSPDDSGHRGLSGEIPADAGRVERLAEWLCGAALLVMIALIGAEALLRNLFGGSLQMTDEICGYLLVALTFLSMSVAEAHRAFHRVELFLARLPRRGQQRLMVVFDLASLAACAVLTWQLGRLAMNSLRTEDVAPTPLQTPLWLPQAVMALGTLLLCWALLRSIRARLRLLRDGSAA